MAATIAEKLTAIAEAKEAIKVAIEAKGVEVANAPLSEYPAKIEAIESGGGNTPQPAIKWTGHADAEGLRAIGWDDDDIAYYQEHGVNWNEEEDELHKVTDDNKALYGVLTHNNISTYRDRIVYLPKIDITPKGGNMSSMFANSRSLVAVPLLDTSSATNMSAMFNGCYSLVTIPPLDTSRVTKMENMFYNCYSLVTIPPIDTSIVTSMSYMFNNCHSLVTIPPIDTSSATNMSYMFYSCYSLVAVPPLDTSSATNMRFVFYGCRSLATIPLLDTSRATDISGLFHSCYPLVAVPLLDTSSATDMSAMFYGCYTLSRAMIKAIGLDFDISSSKLITHTSLMYIINNAKDLTGGTTRTLTLGSTNLAKLTDDEKAIIIAKNWTLA